MSNRAEEFRKSLRRDPEDKPKFNDMWEQDSKQPIQTDPWADEEPKSHNSNKVFGKLLDTTKDIQRGHTKKKLERQEQDRQNLDDYSYHMKYDNKSTATKYFWLVFIALLVVIFVYKTFLS